jgi:hypothetical protein
MPIVGLALIFAPLIEKIIKVEKKYQNNLIFIYKVGAKNVKKLKYKK